MQNSERGSFKTEGNKIQIHCPSHPSMNIILTCLNPRCEYPTLICSKCIIENPEHCALHKEWIGTIEELTETRDMKLRGCSSQLIDWKSSIDEILYEKTQRLNEFQSLHEKEALKIINTMVECAITEINENKALISNTISKLNDVKQFENLIQNIRRDALLQFMSEFKNQENIAGRA